MIGTTTDIRDTLDSLLEVCRDGTKGFELAASAVNNPTLRAELMQYSMQRDEFALQLQDTISVLGEKPSEHGSVSGALHRAWMNVRSAVASNDPHAILSECERGEDSAVERYSDALSRGLPEPVSALIEAQYDAIQRVHDRIKDLRDATTKN